MTRSKLEHHQIKKGMLQAPLNTLPRMELLSWHRDRLPEYLWLGLILMAFDRKTGLSKVCTILKSISENAQSLVAPKFSSILSLPQSEQEIIYTIIEKELSTNLLFPLTAIYRKPEHKIFNNYFYLKKVKIVEKLSNISEAIKLYYDHQSHTATDLRFCVCALAVYKGRVVFHSEIKHCTEAISNYVDTNHEDEEMGKYRSFIRVMEQSLCFSEINSTFNTHFWKEVGMKTQCKPIGVSYTKESENDYSINIVKYKNALDYLTKCYKKELLFDHKFDVIIGSFTYALKLFNEVIEHNLGNSILARHALRTIAEVYIMLKYLTSIGNEQPGIWEKYKLYGIGKYKLQLLKLRERPVNDVSHFPVEFADFLINEMQWEEFQDMEVKYFDKGIREKSIAVNEKELYDIAYDYDTNFVHGFWGAIRESSMYQCDNASHQYHLIPDIGFESNLLDACKDMQGVIDKLFKLICTIYPVSDDALESEIHAVSKP